MEDSFSGGFDAFIISLLLERIQFVSFVCTESLQCLNEANTYLWSRVDNKTNGKFSVHQSASSQQDLKREKKRFLEVSSTDLGGGQGGRLFALKCEGSGKVVEFLVGPLALYKAVCQLAHLVRSPTVSKQCC